MQKGMRVQKKGDNVVGVVDEVIGNIAIVTYSHHKEKVPVAQLELAEKRVTKEDYDRYIDEALDYHNLNKIYKTDLPSEVITELQLVISEVFKIHSKKLFDDYES
ncbi:hypothetical protein E4P35_12440 [Thiopseudomonas sp. 4R-3cl]|nr:hypothetical protein E4P35_12440 [Thiopseudomonas sp. 4R-3cl]